jgi:hypothetical protein
LDFLCELPRHLSTDVMKHLGNDLKSHALLLVGLNFSDWVTRIFLRVSRQDPLSRVTLRERLGAGINFHFQLEDQVRNFCPKKRHLPSPDPGDQAPARSCRTVNRAGL